MHAYLPTDLRTLLLAGGLLLVILAAGFALQCGRRRRGLRRAAAWGLAAAAVAAMHTLCAAQPAGFRMLALVAALLYGMKAVVALEAPLRRALTPGQWMAFAAGWFGMRAAPFRHLGGAPRPGGGALVRRGALRLIQGLALCAGAWGVWRCAGPGRPALLGATLLLLPGLSFVLHFGMFNLLAGLWRRRGVAVGSLFRNPIRAESLGEFWGRRWNLAFSEMTALAVFRPLRRPAGPRLATLAAFLFSGLLHEIAISLPVRSGYGLPMLYFAIQAAGMEFERRAGAGRLRTLVWVLLPVPLVFHPWFLRGVIWPIVGIG